MSKSFDELESEIRNLRNELDKLSIGRAKTSGDESKEWKARVALAETALKNCSAIADYVRKVSKSVANEIDERSKMVAQTLEEAKKTKDLKTLHEWYRTDLAPLFNKVEQEEHLVSNMRRRKT
jgi:ElaB/YqjD/DUF883 family membrane-anchored ribosome-binding protein